MPSISFTLSLRGNLLSSVVGPESLFYAGEVGQFMEVDPLYLYQDTAGTQPVTATGQSVALHLDQSKGLVLGPELVTNGDFSNGSTGWTLNDGWSVASSALVSTAAASGTSTFQSLVGLKPNTTYRVTFDISGYSAGFFYAHFFAGGEGSPWQSGNGPKSVLLTTPSSVENGNFGLTAVFSAFTGTIDNISVKELPGNHDTQPTVGSRPIYGKHPANGYRNMLASSEDFSAAVWAKNSVAVPSARVATYVGSMGIPESRLIQQLITVGGGTASKTFTLSAVVSGTGKIRLKLTQGGVTDTFSQNITLSSTPTLVTFTVTNGSSPGTGVEICGFVASSDDVAFSLTTAGIQLDNGPATTHQRTGASSGVAWPAPPSYDITEAGQPDLHYLHYNGVSSFMVSPTITPGVDKAQVFVGVRKLSDAAVGYLIEFSANLFDNNGTFGFAAPGGSLADFQFVSKGTALAAAEYVVAAPITRVISGLGDISGDTLTIRQNGTQVAQSTADQGTGNYLAYPIYTGRRAGTSFPFNGLVYSKIIRFGANLTADQIASTERWTAQRTGVSL